MFRVFIMAFLVLPFLACSSTAKVEEKNNPTVEVEEVLRSQMTKLDEAVSQSRVESSDYLNIKIVQEETALEQSIDIKIEKDLLDKFEEISTELPAIENNAPILLRKKNK